MSTTPWIRKLQILYSTTIVVWAISFAIVVYAATQTGDWGSIAGISIIGIGPVYFLVESVLLAKQPDDEALASSKRLFRTQRTLGILVTVGAIVGLLPAFANFLSFAEMDVQNLLLNAGMLSWALVYVYMVVFFIAEGIRRGLKLKRQPTAEPARAEPSTKPIEEKPTESTAARPPIAPNLFFVAAILLALFTAQIESTAFTMARNGELTQLGTPGMAFSFLQFIDLGANGIALAVLIFGILNYARDTARFRKIVTPLAALVALIVPPGAAGMALAGITGVSPETAQRNENAQISSDWINNLIESGHPDGFTTISSVYDCAAENCADPDSGYTLSREGDTTSVAADVCATVISWAVASGANEWSTAPDYVPYPLTSAEDADANASCVTSLADYPALEHPYSIVSATFRLTGDGDVPFQMDLVEIDMGTSDPNPDAFNYSLTIATTFVPDELLPGQDQLTDGTHELNDMLDAIGQARLKNPDIDPNDAALIRDALATYPHDIPVTPLVDKDGKIRFIEITQSDENQPMCVCVAPWDDEFEGMEDPGSGYGVSSEDSVSNLKANAHFAATAWGHCDE